MTPNDLFPGLPDEADLWIYALERPLTEAEQRTLLDQLHRFMGTWTSHQRPVQGAMVLLEDRFILLAAQVPDGDLSGCGIDKSVHVLAAAAQQLGTGLMGNLAVVYRDATGQVQATSRHAFRQMIRDGRVSERTPVFDLSLRRVGDWRRGVFERPAADAWVAVFFTPTLAAG
jgi:hypothetical protein